MRKAILIIVLGLLWCNSSFAEKMNVKEKVKLPTDVARGYEILGV